jgi:long-chain acyl-CoA synthetase
MVIGVRDAYRGEAVKAFVVLRAGAKPFELDELRAFLGDRLGRHELPVALEYRSSLPRTSVGKYARRTLREAAGSCAG